MICPKCGHDNIDGSIDCFKCGIIFSKYNERWRERARQEEEERTRQEEYARQQEMRKQQEALRLKEEEKARQEEEQRLKAGNKCRYCMEMVHADAQKCRFCGEWLDVKIDDIEHSIDMKYFLSGLFDFSFIKLITPGLIRAQFAVFLVIFTIAEIITFFIKIKIKIKNNAGLAFGSILVYFILILMGRLWSELMMVAFKIEVNTRHRR